MKVIGFDKKERVWSLSCNTSVVSDKNRSDLHISCRELLREIFPYDIILEEILLPGSNREARQSLLYADFFLPNKKLIVEVHGKQHYEYIRHFHKTKLNFRKSIARDNDKIEWCELNNFSIVILPYNNIDSWKGLINDRK